MAGFAPLHPMLFVKNLARMSEFYAAVSGAEIRATPAPEIREIFVNGRAALALHAVPKEVAEAIEITVPPRRRAEAATKIRFEVDDLDEARARVVAEGAFADEPFAWARRRYCDFIDPEGNVVQLVEVEPPSHDGPTPS